MKRRSFLQLRHAYKNAKSRQKHPGTNIQAPDIFIIPPEEDQTPPWCCYNAQQSLGEAEDEDHPPHPPRYPPVPSYTRHFHRGTLELEDSILPTCNGSSETRSIVDALGDADDYSDNEMDHEPMDLDFEEAEEDDGVEPEMGMVRDRTLYRPDEHCCQPRHLPESLSMQQDIGDDSDVVEVVRVRRHRTHIDNTDDNFFGPSGRRHGQELNTKSSFRSRATKVFRSLRGTIRSTSKLPSKSKDPTISLSGSGIKSKSSKPHSKSRSKPRAQDIFSPIDNIPSLDDRPSTAEVPRRPSSHLSQLFSPVVKQHSSAASFTTSQSGLGAPSPYNQESVVQPASPFVAHRSSVGPTAPSRRSSSSTQDHRESIDQYQEADDVPTPTRNSYQRPFEEDEPTPSWRTSAARGADHHLDPRSASPTPAPRSISPTPSDRQARKHFSVLNLRKIFQKSSSSNVSDIPPPHGDQAPSTTSAYSASTCPSLTSASTSEWSGRTTPTIDSLPQTPTSIDEDEVARTIVSAPSCSTIDSGVSLGSSFHSAAIGSLSSNTVSSAATAAARGNTSSFDCPPDRISTSTIGSGGGGQSDSLFSATDGSIGSDQEPPRTSITSTSTASSGGHTANGRVSAQEKPGQPVASRVPEFDLSLKLDLDLNLGLGVNVASSSSGGTLSSGGTAKPHAKSGSKDHSSNGSSSMKPQAGASIPRSLSLKNIGSKLGLGKQQAPPIPPLPVPNSVEDADMSMEMKLDSFHFDDLSFDADRFLAR